MPTLPVEDRPLTPQEIADLTSADALARFFTDLGYPAGTRQPMTAEALALNQSLTDATRHVERLASVDGALEVYLFVLTSVTVAYTRALARTFRDLAGNFLLVLTDDYRRLDFVLLERELPGTTRRVPLVRPRVLTVDHRDPDRVALRVLRRFTFTEVDEDGEPDPYAQYDKLKSAFTIAEWSEPLFNNRALFSDYYLNERLPDLAVWDAPDRNQAFRDIRKAFAQARQRVRRDPTAAPDALIRPVLQILGFHLQPGPGGAQADLLLYTSPPPGERQSFPPSERRPRRGNTKGEADAFALTYPWHRYLDGKDAADPERPDENPGAQVVSLLDQDVAPWAIVTNGKTWRLYSARAHSRATNYYEIDLEEILALADPADAFRYFYLLFRAAAFAPESPPPPGETTSSFKSPPPPGEDQGGGTAGERRTFLDYLLDESTAYARELGERLKTRVFEEVFPHFAEGFIQGRGGPDALLALPDDAREQQLQLVFDATLTFLYRLLFLLYAESRDLLPVREARGYRRISLRQLKETVAEKAGPIEDEVPDSLADAYDERATALYQDLKDLFEVIAEGSATYNVPIYNGGLFQTDPDPKDTGRDAVTARFLLETRMPDRYLALGLDRLARDVDPKHGGLGFIDYKSLGVRQLGSIYEGLLEFKVRVAPETMAVVEGAKTEEVVPLAEAQREGRKILTAGRGGNAAPRTLERGAVYLENDRRERKATGSYYTPDYIVKYIVRHTVGPVMDEKLAALRPRLQETERGFRAAVQRKLEMEGVSAEDLNRPALLQNVAGDLLRDLFDVKILDPAMGSGHFLVEAVDYVTDRLVRFLDGFPFLATFFEGMRASILDELRRQEVTVDPAQLTDVTLLKRHVLKRCIYGVDLNPMAVELAKVSLWLDCFTLGAPLSFLDHHLRCGNSLIGAMAQDVAEEMAAPGAAGQMTFLTGPFVGLLRAAEIMRGISALTDVTLEQVQESNNLFKAFDRAAKPYKQLLDIHVAQHFGVDRGAEFLKLYGADALRADKADLAEPYQEVIEQARQLYEEKRFFHWDLEFPEVFIDLERADWEENGGFDAVIGNPPWMSFSGREHQMIAQDMRDYYISHFVSSSGWLATHTLFGERAVDLLASTGRHAFIVPDQVGYLDNYRAFRAILSDSVPCMLSIVNYTGEGVFREVTSPTLIYVASRRRTSEVCISDREGRQQCVNASTITQDPLRRWRVAERDSIWQKMRSYSLCFETEFGDPGVHTGNCAAKLILEEPEGRCAPVLEGSDVKRYNVPAAESWLRLDYVPEPGEYFTIRDLSVYRSTRIIIRQTAGYPIATIHPGERFRNSLLAYFGHPQVSDRYVLAVLNSKLIKEFYLEQFVDAKQEVFPQVKVGYLRQIPFRQIHFVRSSSERNRMLASLIDTHGTRSQRSAQSTIASSTQQPAVLAAVGALLPKDADGTFLAFKPGATGAEEKSDVVHDLLAYLAEQMIDMHREKHARIDAFWRDLKAATDPATFDTLRNKGKWEQSLAKDPACAPYVDPDSRSTRNLDDSLGWDDACFQAFAQMLVGKTPVTPALTRVYTQHAAAYQALATRIHETDDLIDQIVYRLYGLTEEEIAVVEGRA